MYKYEEVSELKLATYLEDIKRELAEKAPEWMVNMMSSPSDDKAVLNYHLCRWDFTKGKDQKWPVNFFQGVFAYEEGIGKERKFYILNYYPLTENSYAKNTSLQI